METAAANQADAGTRGTSAASPEQAKPTLSATIGKGPVLDPEHEQTIRSRGLQLRGQYLPQIGDIALTYRDAWCIGKQGCLGARRSLWDPHLFSGTWYFVCDGTDPSNFLVLHSHKDAKTYRRIIISLWELIDGFWVGNKCRVLYQPRNEDGSSASSSTQTMVIEGFTRQFYEAIIKCVQWVSESCAVTVRSESQVRLQLMQIELQQLQLQFTRNNAAPCNTVAARPRRSWAGYSESGLQAAGLNNYTAPVPSEEAPPSPEDVQVQHDVDEEAPQSPEDVQVQHDVDEEAPPSPEDVQVQHDVDDEAPPSPEDVQVQHDVDEEAPQSPEDVQVQHDVDDEAPPSPEDVQVQHDVDEEAPQSPEDVQVQHDVDDEAPPSPEDVQVQHDVDDEAPPSPEDVQVQHDVDDEAPPSPEDVQVQHDVDEEAPQSPEDVQVQHDVDDEAPPSPEDVQVQHDVDEEAPQSPEDVQVQHDVDDEAPPSPEDVQVQHDVDDEAPPSPEDVQVQHDVDNDNLQLKMQQLELQLNMDLVTPRQQVEGAGA